MMQSSLNDNGAKNLGITEEEYMEFIQPYADAMRNMQARLEVLNRDYGRKYQNNPIHHIQFRLKSRESIETKLERKGWMVGTYHAKNYLTDIAGARIICYFKEDVYGVVAMLKKQSDMVVIKETDYIKNPKENGYRSYHLVLGYPVYHTDGMEYYPIELQLRTMAMDLWASMEHRICYKPSEGIQPDLSKYFFQYARLLEELEQDISQHRNDAR